MFIDWQLLLASLGGTLISATAVVGAAAWLAKAIVSDRLARQAEEFKTQLKADADAANEQLKHALQLTALEHQVRFAKLHEKRALVIEEVYQRLIDAEKGYGRFIFVDAYKEPEAQQKARLETQTMMYDTSLFIEKHRIYLPKKTCDSLKEFLDIMWTNAIGVGVYSSIENPTQKTLVEREDVFRKAYEALEKGVPAARTILEEEFRGLLGGETKADAPQTLGST